MTIPVEKVRYVYVGPFNINDTIPIPFSYIETDHVKVSISEEDLRQGVDYTVFGKNVTIKKNVSASEMVVVYRDTPLDQGAEFPQDSKYDSQKIAEALDKLTMQNQEQEDGIFRAIKFPKDTDEGVMGEVTFPLPDPGKGIKWNKDGTNLENSKYDLDEIIDIAKEEANKAAASAAESKKQAENAAASEAEAKRQAANAANSAAQAKDSASKANDYSEEARKWAIGTEAERPEGSSKYWAERARRIVGGDVYDPGDFIKIEDFTISLDAKTFTKTQWNGMSTTEKEKVTLAMIYED